MLPAGTWSLLLASGCTFCRFNLYRYIDIARRTVAVHRAQKQRLPPASAAQQQQRQKQAATSVSHSLGQEVYRVALTTAFLLQAVAAGFVPYIGAQQLPRPPQDCPWYATHFVDLMPHALGDGTSMMLCGCKMQAGRWSWPCCRGCTPCTASTTGALRGSPPYPSRALCRIS